MSLRRHKSLKRGATMERGKPLSRTAFKKRRGRVGKLRADGNREARRYYFEHFSYMESPGWAPCQVCGRSMNVRDCDAHHKMQAGEDLMNKLAAHKRCHLKFIHDLNRPRHRLEVVVSPVNVMTGGQVQWSPESRARLEHVLGLHNVNEGR